MTIIFIVIHSSKISFIIEGGQKRIYIPVESSRKKIKKSLTLPSKRQENKLLLYSEAYLEPSQTSTMAILGEKKVMAKSC